MKFRTTGLLTVVFLFVFLQKSFGQWDYPLEFKTALQAAQLDFYEPLENSFKPTDVQENDLQTYEFAIRSKEEKVEIRYAILPAAEQSDFFQPSVHFALKASSLARNNEESSIMVFHAVDNQDLIDTFNADWGAAVFFQPKASFSRKQHCKMLALYKEGRANVFVFYLFDDLSVDLDREQFQNIRFATSPEN